MGRHLEILLLYLKHSTHNITQLAQILAHTITTGLVHTTLTWNCLVRAYSKSPTPITAILIYNHFIKTTCISPDNHTYPALLKACSRLLSLPKGKEIHAHVTKIALDSDIYVQNSLIHFYGSTARVNDARRLFDTMPQRDLVSWNSVLATSIASPGLWVEALMLFKEMVFDNVGADDITMIILLSVCTQVEGIEYGRTIHGYVIKLGIRCTLNLENALLGMYAKGGDMGMALGLFFEMGERRDVVSYTILINGYVELGLVDPAREFFDQIVFKDLVTWNSMIHGYVKAKHPKEALELFKEMEIKMVKPDETTIVSVLAACANLSDLRYGRLVHRFILQRNIRLDVFLGTALIDMYCKCGSLEDAMAIFYGMDYRDVFAWTALITGFANYGQGNEALSLFKQMEKQGMVPNEATFVSVLMACSRSGMVKAGLYLFKRMVGFYKIKPKIEHFGCLADLLSRAGLLYEADDFIRTMPAEERLVAYKTLLSACINHFDFDLGKTVAKELMKLGPQSHRVYILLSNFYALAGQWAEVVEIRKLMKVFDMRKEVGISSIEQQS
ncbi:hypothetical protein HHK36_004799 [Tetracentron sinense]|uniref:Pentatricopeptide repeat-containing protein n=1 Tax=Tetracentron sinense TaxID=13715 RepID=A0A834ZKI3_TETSI|nr:hypothetical protein HHK36_004799 [Tetracentron sinense]